MRLFIAFLAAGTSLASIGYAQTAPLNPASLRPSRLSLDNGVKVAQAAAGAATLNKTAGVVTTEALTTPTGGLYTLTVTDLNVGPADQVFASVAFGTSTTGVPVVSTIKPQSGSFVVVIRNADAIAFNGSLKISFAVLKN